MVKIITLCKSFINIIDKSQENLLLNFVREARIEGIDISNVDKVKGIEVDIVIVWCSISKEMNYASDSMNLSIALSRAKKHLILVGRYNTLSKNLLWNKLINKAKTTAKVISSKLIDD